MAARARGARADACRPPGAARNEARLFRMFLRNCREDSRLSRHPIESTPARQSDAELGACQGRDVGSPPSEVLGQCHVASAEVIAQRSSLLGLCGSLGGLLQAPHGRGRRARSARRRDGNGRRRCATETATRTGDGDAEGDGDGRSAMATAIERRRPASDPRIQRRCEAGRSADRGGRRRRCASGDGGDRAEAATGIPGLDCERRRPGRRAHAGSCAACTVAVSGRRRWPGRRHRPADRGRLRGPDPIDDHSPVPVRAGQGGGTAVPAAAAGFGGTAAARSATAGGTGGCLARARRRAAPAQARSRQQNCDWRYRGWPRASSRRQSPRRTGQSAESRLGERRCDLCEAPRRSRAGGARAAQP